MGHHDRYAHTVWKYKYNLAGETSQIQYPQTLPKYVINKNIAKLTKPEAVYCRTTSYVV